MISVFAILPKKQQELIDSTRQSHSLTEEFVQHSGMQLNAQKCFTFGHTCVANSLPHIESHKTQFRLVGASMKFDAKKEWTALEKERKAR